ncbi:class I SAM-dependent methyltransferase [Paenibacillus sp. FSL W7-1279]|uniref:class I SAM-dependent methyltransferase n=2 Tax=Paenibacillus TaxID=44249 RepID=UPI00188DB913|nr:class I SAM-dependent methyltransferase [Paenibacillus lautus]MBX4148645.1 class I SAM-dependent methyltransferase [Paenibacillus lautus]
MYHGVRFDMNFKQLWLEGMKDWNGNLPERMSDDAKEESFWEGFIPKKTDALDDYAADIRRELLQFIEPTDDVLEIGPGWGNYTFAAADKASSLVCVDSSRSVLNHLKKDTKRQGHQNIRFIHSKWEDSVPKKQFDVVFGINCYYRMQEIDRALLNMNNSSKRWAIIGLTTGPEKPHLWEIHQELGYKVKFQRRDYIYLTNLLYELGIDVNCKIVNLERIYRYENEEQLLKDNLGVILEANYDRKATEKILRQFVTEENGILLYKHRFKAALLYWRPEEMIFKKN